MNISGAYSAAREYMMDARRELHGVLPIPQLGQLIHLYLYSQLEFENALYAVTKNEVDVAKILAERIMADELTSVQDWRARALAHHAQHDSHPGESLQSLDYLLRWSHSWFGSHTKCSRLWCWFTTCQCGCPLIAFAKNTLS